MFGCCASSDPQDELKDPVEAAAALENQDPLAELPAAVSTKSEPAQEDEAPKEAVAAPAEPVAADESFQVMLDKGSHSTLGLDLDLPDAKPHLIIIKTIKDGSILLEWNAQNPDKEVRKGDCIVEVNGTKGSASNMMQAAKDSSTLTLTLRRPKVSMVNLKKSEKPMGISLNYDDKLMGLLVVKVTDGSVKDSGADIKENDIIIAVNGKEQLPSEMLASMQQSESMELTVYSYD
eukprot:TRINITY_DN37080_c0_g1_i1.p1 TRINITY_DN37080_c0_g1~~TRINITY_DN37080_c0_g1_i1.p1  ORF type:complete len:234 (+),score=70.82 TRINITY_DN37080_c0_g1_i1:56-757(+)